MNSPMEFFSLYTPAITEQAVSFLKTFAESKHGILSICKAYNSQANGDTPETIYSRLKDDFVKWFKEVSVRDSSWAFCNDNFNEFEKQAMIIIRKEYDTKETVTK